MADNAESRKSRCPKLIEVTLPIREISAESVRDKSLRHGHISTLHLWWARRPLAAARAVVFASLVPDPDDSRCPEDFRKAVERDLKTQVPEALKHYLRGRKVVHDSDPYRPYNGIPDTLRNRLLMFIAKWSPESLAFEAGKSDKEVKPEFLLDDRSLVKWETSDPENRQGREILRIARDLVKAAYGGKTPVVLDPFAGGGAIPLEVGRLGCQPIANDYNPVAYLILRATCEFPQKYGKPGKRKVTVEEFGKKIERDIHVPNVLAYDVEKWAKWILERAREKIGHLYPPGEDGKRVVGYLWARTAPCSNPSCRGEIPLLRSLLVCNKSDKKVALRMEVDEKGKAVTFLVAKGDAIRRTAGTMESRGNVVCPFCEQVTPVADIRKAGIAEKLGERMVAAILEGMDAKDYRPIEEADRLAFASAADFAGERPGEYIVPEINSPSADLDAGSHRSINLELYGLKRWGQLFNQRQLAAMNTFIACLQDALGSIRSEIPDEEYRKAVIILLGLWVSRIASRCSNVGVWHTKGEKLEHPFGRQAIPMTWDYPESNPFSESTGGAVGQLGWMLRVINRESLSGTPASVCCGDAASLPLGNSSVELLTTDPPYFDVVAYADLSDYFYIWLKRGLGEALPDFFHTPQTPKSQEATAHKHRHHGDAEQGRAHFERKLREAFCEANRVMHRSGIVSIIFAHQSTEAWTALVKAIFGAGLGITGTWPIDTELVTALKAHISSLSSSVTVS